MSIAVAGDSTRVWQPDSEVTECFLCHETFTFFFRRHHCRRCGKVVCGKCSTSKTIYDSETPVISPPNSLFPEPVTEAHRTCDYCVEELITHNVAARNRTGDLPNNGETSNPVLVPGHSSRNSVKDTSEQRTQRVNDTDGDSERDRCPICALNISPLTEPEREEHINDCLIQAEFSGSPDQHRSNNRMLVYTIPDPQKKPIVISCSDCTYNDNLSPSSIIKEKFNFINDNECVICFEELAPGDKVGRLECLCVFHYKCIKGWFEKKGPGNCPIHAVQY